LWWKAGLELPQLWPRNSYPFLGVLEGYPAQVSCQKPRVAGSAEIPTAEIAEKIPAVFGLTQAERSVRKSRTAEIASQERRQSKGS